MSAKKFFYLEQALLLVVGVDCFFLVALHVLATYIDVDWVQMVGIKVMYSLHKATAQYVYFSFQFRSFKQTENGNLITSWSGFHWSISSY